MTQAKGVMVCGPSGGGKSTYTREGHDTADCPSIFLTTKKNERKAAKDPPWRLRESGCSYPGDIQTARQWALGRGGGCQVIVDEVQNAPTFSDGAQGPCYKMLHEDREREIKPVLVTQNPMDLRTSEHGYGPVQQAEYWVFCGKLKDWHVGFLRANNMGGLVDHMPTEHYDYVVIEPTAALSGEEKIVYRGRTKREFG